MLDERITDTFIGREFGWDRVSQADPALLRQNRECAMKVLNNRDDFPNAMFDYVERRVAAIDQFFYAYGYLLNEYATDEDADYASDMASARMQFA